MTKTSKAPASTLRVLWLCGLLLVAFADLAAAQFATDHHPWVIGHRGGTVFRPENTLDTYDYSMTNGVTGVEFDVWLSSDGFPVCHHDHYVDRTTDGTGIITDKTLAEILTLDAGSWFGAFWTGTRVPRFEEGLQVIEGRGKLVLDIKAVSYVPTIVTYIENEGFPKDDVWVWNRFGTGAPFAALMPEAHIISEISPGSDRESFIFTRTQLGEDAIDVPYLRLDKDYVDLAHSYGVLVMSHTLVSPRFQEQIDIGVDIVVASHPTLFAANHLPGITPECRDGIDNDGDGFTDFPSDPGCWGNQDGAELAACSDGIDNDFDGLVDYPNDPGCFAPFYTIENPECSDGIDNNGDGNIDFPDDEGCFAAFDQGELPACSNGIDDDGDGFMDYPDDPGCESVSGITEYPECNDGHDNDGDGMADFPNDTGCTSAYDISESNTIQPACNDALDNDGDGLFDHPEDPDCLGRNDNSEAPECNDGIDNDFDGQIDLADPDCISGTDPTEQSECVNGLDDDGDGLIDYPVDPKCEAATDPFEVYTDSVPSFGAWATVVLALILAFVIRQRFTPERLEKLR